MKHLEKYENYLNEEDKTSNKPIVTKTEIKTFVEENGGSPLKEIRDSEGSIDWLYDTMKTMSESFANSTELRIKTAAISADFKKHYPTPILEESEGAKTMQDLDDLVKSILN